MSYGLQPRNMCKCCKIKVYGHRKSIIEITVIILTYTHIHARANKHTLMHKYTCRIRLHMQIHTPHRTAPLPPLCVLVYTVHLHWWRYVSSKMRQHKFFFFFLLRFAVCKNHEFPQSVMTLALKTAEWKKNKTRVKCFFSFSSIALFLFLEIFLFILFGSFYSSQRPHCMIFYISWENWKQQTYNSNWDFITLHYHQMQTLGSNDDGGSSSSGVAGCLDSMFTQTTVHSEYGHVSRIAFRQSTIMPMYSFYQYWHFICMKRRKQ